MEKELAPNSRLPVDLETDNIFHLFKAMSTRSTHYKRKMFIELTIPLTEKSEYTLYKAIALPIKREKSTSILEIPSTYFFINPEHGLYTPTSLDEIQGCTHMANNTLICSPTEPTYHSTDNICTVAILKSKIPEIQENCKLREIPSRNYVLPIVEKNIYYFYLWKPTKIHVSCSNSKSEFK